MTETKELNEEEKEVRNGLVQIGYEINDENYQVFNRDFNSMSLDPEVDQIIVKICSPGGSASIGLAIAEEIRLSHKPVATVIQGEAASAAAIIAQAGDKRYMTRFSTLVLHQAGVEYEHVRLTVSRLATVKKNLDKINMMMFKIFAEKTGKSVKEIKRLIGDDNKIFTADEALAYGLIDEII